MKDRTAFIAFLVSLAFISFLYGFFASARSLFPAGILWKAYYTAEDLAMNWRNDFGFEPTRLLVEAKPEERSNLGIGGEPAPMTPQVMTRPGAFDGKRFISGLTPGREALSGAILVDRSGRELHYWPIDFNRLSSGNKSPNNVYLHGIEPLPDGSIVVNFDNGDLLARIGACGEVMWITAGRFHHVVTLSHDGTLWSWESPQHPDPRAVADAEQADGNRETQYLVQLDAETGERLRNISLERDVIAANGLFGRMAMRTVEGPDKLIYCCDPFHPNDIEALPPQLAGAFPMFAAGDLLISLRSINMVGVLDRETMALKWSSVGPWHQQHDPDFLPDGTISVFNNNMGLGASQIITTNPATGENRVVFDGAERGNFYSWRRGRHQRLPNGNMIIAESEKGRVIEVNRTGEIVWAYENVYDRDRNGLINDAVVLADDFFEEGALSCPGPATERAAGG
jgi:hypothetical protein